MKNKILAFLLSILIVGIILCVFLSLLFFIIEYPFLFLITVFLIVPVIKFYPIAKEILDNVDKRKKVKNHANELE